MHNWLTEEVTYLQPKTKEKINAKTTNLLHAFSHINIK